MNAQNPVPDTYAAWRRCIEVDCGLALTPAFITARLQALADDRDPHTSRFVAQRGDAHRRRVLGWLQETRAATAHGRP